MGDKDTGNVDDFNLFFPNTKSDVSSYLNVENPINVSFD